MNDINPEWPPTYTIRHSRRAKQVILQISPKQGLVVIVPIHRRNPRIEALIQEKQQWIQKNLRLYKTHLQNSAAGIFTPPDVLHFHAIGKTIRFEYQKTTHKSVKILPKQLINSNYTNNPVNEINVPLQKDTPDQEDTPLLGNAPLQKDIPLQENELHYAIIGPIDQTTLLVKALKRFLKQMAQQYLIPWLNCLSQSIQLPYQSAIIRSQSTLWGSCNANKRISLNVKLLFLPEALSRYVLLHELCHTIYLNHSKRYWNLLKRFDPDCLKHRRMLRLASQYLPDWLEK